MNERLKSNFIIALEALVSNRTRSLLTALGIIFGVAAVIAMLAIGTGTQLELNEQMKLVGVNNIVIEPIVTQSEEQVSTDRRAPGEKEKFTPGLTMQDVLAVKEVVPTVNHVSPEVVLDTYIIHGGIRRTAKLVGVEPAYFEIFNFELERGRMFNEAQLNSGAAVCIIGMSIKNRFFPTSNPVGQTIKVGSHWVEIIGVMEPRLISEQSAGNLGIRDYNMDVYVPLETMLIRYRDRAKITETSIRRANAASGDESENESTVENINQLDRLVVQVNETHMLQPTAEVISRLLKRRHYDVVDFQVEIPELLLKQQKRSNELFNYVLGAIAGISLLVGGIGIMNIMLASVLERIKEIGLRLSLGAKKSDIINQFMFESVLISISGGVIGVVLGVLMAYLVAELAEIKTVVSLSSIVISFGVAAMVGLIFGITPARRAAQQNPINSLRYE